MKLEVGKWCRTKKGTIFKIIGGNVDKWEIDIDYSSLSRCENEDYNSYAYNKNNSLFEDLVVKASYNIIDLIKSKDIILGRDGKIYQCWKIYKDYVFTYSKNKQGQTITLVDYQIDKVLSKEQFEQMAYKVGD